MFTGVNGLPPVTASVQGEQLFDFTHGTDSGTFTAVVTTLPIGNHAQGLLVTSSSDPATVPVGSVFDVESLGLGFKMVYADLVGAGANGQNLITQTLVTPWGMDIDLSWLVQGSDAAAHLNPSDGLVSFIMEHGLTSSTYDAAAGLNDVFYNPFANLAQCALGKHRRADGAGVRLDHHDPTRLPRSSTRGVERGKARILVGPDPYLFDILTRVAPTHYYDLLGTAFGRLRSRAQQPASARV